MSENRKYYWLKLPENFFEDDTISYIEEQANGIEYSNFYLKLCLKSLRNEGKLIRVVGELVLPYDFAALSKLTGVSIDVVRSAMTFFEHIGIVKRLESGELYLTQMQELIGSETSKASLMRRKRAIEKLESNNVTPTLPECSKNVTQRLEIENRDRDKEIEIEGRETPTHSPSDIFIEIPLLGGNIAHVTYEYVQRQKELYPSLDVEQQIRSAVSWIEANPTKKKKDWKRFLNGWFQRSMKFEKEDSKPSGNYQRAPKTSSDYNPAVNTGEAETVDF